MTNIIKGRIEEYSDMLGMDREDDIVKVNAKLLCLENWAHIAVYQNFDFLRMKYDVVNTQFDLEILSPYISFLFYIKLNVIWIPAMCWICWEYRKG